ncbi:MAG: glucans biosynthesis glucosyltransferase MdoH [Rhodomicrobiaceae bacterium]
MNDQTPLRLHPASHDSRYTPAGFQETRLLRNRRLIMAGLTLSTIGGLLYVLAVVLGSDGWTALDMGIFAAFMLSAPWTVMGFWNALIGFWLLHLVKNPLGRVAPFARLPAEDAPLALRTAILMTLRNEDPSRAFARLRIMRDSLERTGEASRFDFLVLSDTDKPEVAAEEERLFAEWETEFGDSGRTLYRRRPSNEGFKAGNVRDFLERWGDAYDLMLPLDADSLMSGAEIVKLTRIMQAHPRLGILQSLVTGAPSVSAFARVFQYGMRHGMRSYTMGNAWWNGDCGPYWGHNAVVRVAPFKSFCELPILPGKAPLGGCILSHDQIEATMMRAAGYEVRVLPVEGESWEDNPPSLQEFQRRDTRWCQGNMQYWRLIGLPNLKPLSRFQIVMGIFMYLSALAWTMMIALSALKVFDPEIGPRQIELGIGLFFFSFFLSISPKLMGMLDVLCTRGGVARYGGLLRFLASSFTEIVFSMMLAPVAAVRLSIFMISLLFGRSVVWNGQQRDVHGLTWATAFNGLWPQTLFGFAILALFSWKAPAVLFWAAPLLAGLILAVPFAVFTASPAVGRVCARIGLCSIPEELNTPRDLQRISDPDLTVRGPDASSKSSDRLAAIPSS